MLRQREFFAGHPRRSDGTTDLTWFGADGRRMDPGRWNDTDVRTMQMHLDGGHVDGRSLLVVLHGGDQTDGHPADAAPAWRLRAALGQRRGPRRNPTATTEPSRPTTASP